MKQKQKNQPKKRYFEVKNEEYQQDMSFEETSLKWYQEKVNASIIISYLFHQTFLAATR